MCDSQAVAIGADGSLYVTGSFSGTVDFDPTEAEDIRTAEVGTGIYLSCFAPDGTRAWTLTWTTPDGYTHSGWGNRGWALAIDTDGSIFLGGQYSGTIDLDPGDGVAQEQMLTGFDGFLLKLKTGLLGRCSRSSMLRPRRILARQVHTTWHPPSSTSVEHSLTPLTSA